MAKINRYLEKKILENLPKRKIQIIFGARQVGKTTLVEKILNDSPNSLYLNGDFIDDQKKLGEPSRAMVRQFASYRLLVIDEAQRIPDIGIKLKVIFDALPDIRMIVTGSSAFDISNQVQEPLTGRFLAYAMYPISYAEANVAGRFNLDHALAYGLYPEVAMESDVANKKMLIKNIAANYLFKDALTIEYIKSPRSLEYLLKALADQLGNEVSAHELSNTLGLDAKTVARYLDILEKLFIIFPIHSYFANVRKSVRKKKKYFFYDLGIRNAIMDNFSPPAGRADIGALWENFCIVERMKRNAAYARLVSYYFWRSYAGEEIDMLENEDGRIKGFECKWSRRVLLRNIINRYARDIKGDGELDVITRENFDGFLL